MAVTTNVPDPRKGREAAEEFVATMMMKIVGPLRRTLNAPHDDIVREHMRLTGQNRYLVGPNVFSSGAGSERVKPFIHSQWAQVKPLHPSLGPAHQSWFKDYSAHMSEWRGLMQSLSTVLSELTGWQDIRDAFPEHVLRDMLSDYRIRDLERTRPDIYPGRQEDPTIHYDSEVTKRLQHWSPRVIAQYERVAPTIDFYVGYKLL